MLRPLRFFWISLLVTASAPALPLVFEPNVGQTDPRVRFLARSSQSAFFITDRELVVSGASVVRLRLIGAASAPVVGTVLDEQIINYFRGSDRSRWRRGVRTFAALAQRNVYRGIDAIY